MVSRNRRIGRRLYVPIVERIVGSPELRRRIGMDGRDLRVLRAYLDADRSLEAIGDDEGITGERVRQIVQRRAAQAATISLKRSA